MLSAAADLESQGSLRRSPNPRLPIEMLLLRMSFLDRTVALEELIGALGGAPPATGGAGGTSGAGGGSTPREASTDGGSTEKATTDEATTDGASAHGASTEPGPTENEPDPEVADAAPPEPIVPTDDIREAWSRFVGSGRGTPPGLGPFLHSATVSEDEAGALLITPLPGPALERLRQPTVIEAIREAMTPFLGRRPVLRVEGPEVGQAPAERITREEVHADTLKALYRQEPRLERAVEELDLELME
jgi:hypothetical protein